MTGAPPPARSPYSSATRRYLPLLVWAAIIAAPSAGFAAILAAVGAAILIAPAASASATRRRLARERARSDRRGSGAPLGRTPQGRPVALADQQLAAHALIVGASGAGKSTTLLAILDAEIRRGRPVVAIDMKGSPAFAEQLARSACAAGRTLTVWTPDGPARWNPLTHGNATALKDMLIGIERFTEPHYKRAAERYLQNALAVLLASAPARPVDLRAVVGAMDPHRLAACLRRVPQPMAERVQDYLSGLTDDQMSAIRGLESRLALLDESSAGPHLRASAERSELDLGAGLQGGDVLLISINSSVYGQLAEQLGALAIQDLTAAAGRRLGLRGLPPATVAIDEFSAVGADNVLALLARGRETGVRVLLATQELTDLERAGRGFRDQVLGIVGAKVIHRQDVPYSAELVAQMAGTEAVWERTWSIQGTLARAGTSLGTRRLVERYVVHPNEIKALAPGEAILLVKLPRAEVTRVAVTRPALPPAAGWPDRWPPDAAAVRGAAGARSNRDEAPAGERGGIGGAPRHLRTAGPRSPDVSRRGRRQADPGVTR